ncbi:hypothetical protein SD81_034460 [Tolypothrix campylonemoides VB511288]|nr:hypothetical protein SD81_034460 [Tolypothrix campylonemoides VB511288]
MQQLTFIRRGRLEWREVPEPQLSGPLEALVRPLAVARCDLDAAILFGKVSLRGPFALGHEFVAEVIACGESVKKFQPGQKVVVPFQISCGSCPRCQKNLTGRCSNVPPGSLSIAGAMYGLGSAGGHWGGALSDTAVPLVGKPWKEMELSRDRRRHYALCAIAPSEHSVRSLNNLLQSLGASNTHLVIESNLNHSRNHLGV